MVFRAFYKQHHANAIDPLELEFLDWRQAGQELVTVGQLQVSQLWKGKIYFQMSLIKSISARDAGKRLILSNMFYTVNGHNLSFFIMFFPPRSSRRTQRNYKKH
jgi:hypothetical protein